MSNTTDDTSDVLVLRDQEGNIYLLPRQVVEDARVADDSVAAVKAALGADDDTAGYGIIAPHIGIYPQSFPYMGETEKNLNSKLNLANFRFQQPRRP